MNKTTDCSGTGRCPAPIEPTPTTLDPANPDCLSGRCPTPGCYDEAGVACLPPVVVGCVDEAGRATTCTTITATSPAVPVGLPATGQGVDLAFVATVVLFAGIAARLAARRRPRR